jgi:hypothetical protein
VRLFRRMGHRPPVAGRRGSTGGRRWHRRTGRPGPGRSPATQWDPARYLRLRRIRRARRIPRALRSLPTPSLVRSQLVTRYPQASADRCHLRWPITSQQWCFSGHPGSGSSTSPIILLRRSQLARVCRLEPSSSVPPATQSALPAALIVPRTALTRSTAWLTRLVCSLPTPCRRVESPPHCAA